MSDRTSASLFKVFFEVLASDEPIDRKALALKLWESTGEYDFSPCQMDCDEALVKLGLAEKCPNPGCGIVYADEPHDRGCTAPRPG